MSWRPISDAPKDGTRFLAYGNDKSSAAASNEYCEIACYSGDAAWPWEDARGLHAAGHYSHFALIFPFPTAAQSED